MNVLAGFEAVLLAMIAGLHVVWGLGVRWPARDEKALLPAWRARFPREPFATFDRRLYSPLCLVIAATCAILLLNPTR